MGKEGLAWPHPSQGAQGLSRGLRGAAPAGRVVAREQQLLKQGMFPSSPHGFHLEVGYQILRSYILSPCHWQI